jgi:hypothetical protein
MMVLNTAGKHWNVAGLILHEQRFVDSHQSFPAGSHSEFLSSFQAELIVKRNNLNGLTTLNLTKTRMCTAMLTVNPKQTAVNKSSQCMGKGTGSLPRFRTKGNSPASSVFGARSSRPWTSNAKRSLKKAKPGLRLIARNIVNLRARARIEVSL